MLVPSTLEDGMGVDVERPFDGREEGATADMICFLLVFCDLCVADTDKVSRVGAYKQVTPCRVRFVVDPSTSLSRRCLRRWWRVHRRCRTYQSGRVKFPSGRSFATNQGRAMRLHNSTSDHHMEHPSVRCRTSPSSTLGVSECAECALPPNIWHAVRH